MSEENVEVVRRMYEAYLAGDAEQALTHFHPDVVVDFSVRGDTGVRKGREALSEIVATWVGTWDDYSEQLDEIRELGDKVLIVSTQSGRGKGSGVELTNQFAQLYELKNGQITSATMYESPAKALEAAGLSE